MRLKKTTEKHVRELSEKEKRFVCVPESILLDEENNRMAIPLICYLQIRKGLDDESLIATNDVVRWMQRKNNYNLNGINTRIMRTLRWLDTRGYIKLLEEPAHRQFTRVIVNMDAITSKNADGNRRRFARLYMDELATIMGSEYITGVKGVKAEFLLMLMTWVRMYTARRTDYADDPDKLPETAISYFKCIAQSLNIQERMLDDGFTILKDLKLIHFHRLPNYRCGKGWKSSATIFCNYYRRTEKMLLAYGEDYYKTEIEAGVYKMVRDINRNRGDEHEDIKLIKQSGAT